VLPASAAAATFVAAAASTSTAAAATFVAAAAAATFVATATAATFVATAAAATFVATATATTTTTAGAGFGCVDAKRATAEVFFVECLDGIVEAALVSECDECEAFGLSGVAVSDDFDAFDGAEFGEENVEIVFGSGVGQVAHVNIHIVVLKWCHGEKDSLQDHGTTNHKKSGKTDFCRSTDT